MTDARQRIDPSAAIVVAVSSSKMGRNDDALGEVLMRSFLHTLGDVAPRPNILIFFNEGVKLAVEGSPVLEDLKILEDQGTRILLCGTCLGNFQLKDSVMAGEISNMHDIAETMLRAAKVINI